MIFRSKLEKSPPPKQEQADGDDGRIDQNPDECPDGTGTGDGINGSDGKPDDPSGDGKPQQSSSTLTEALSGLQPEALSGLQHPTVIPNEGHPTLAQHLVVATNQIPEPRPVNIRPFLDSTTAGPGDDGKPGADGIPQPEPPADGDGDGDGDGQGDPLPGEIPK